jgi:chondroitin-sulfate-ABC endolyase/exolyase
LFPEVWGGIKEDGSGFHHGGLYPAYCNGGYAGIGTFLRYVNGTCFALSKEARINFGKALMAMRNYSNRKDWGFGISGRHPLGGSMSNSVKNAFAYLAKSGNPHTGAAVWEDVAAAYMRLESASTAFKQEFAGMGISAEGEPNGNYTYNYGALGIHRRNSWMVSIKGYNKYVWGSEIYTNDNRYGRYQSYGTIQVMGTGNPVSSSESGFVQDGWDWNRYPGATSIHLPLDLLESPYSDSYMDKSSEGFTGASNLEGENGIFGMKLRESSKPNFTGDHKANKSVFCFEDRIICLGSDVANTNAYHNTETTLFQVNLKNQSTPVYVDGSNAVSSFPYDNSLSEDQNHWLMDPVGNGYWVRQGCNVKVSRSVQDSRHNKTKAATQGSFATAWINHGAAPDSKTYEYVILPSSNLQAVQDFSSRMEAEETAAYKVLQQDRKAHIVWDRASNTTGYVFFELNSQVNNEFVKGITAPGLVMIKASQDKKELSLSLCDPDLHFPEVAYTSAKPSQESLIELTLKGNWEVSQNNSNCKVLLQEDTQTRSDPPDCIAH